MSHRAKMTIHPPDQGVATVPHLLADRVGRDRRPAVERLQPCGAVGVPEDVGVNLTTGVGKGIADHLVAKGYAVTYFDRSTPGRDKRYGNPRAEAYMTMREAFQAGTAAIPPNEELLAELLAVKYEVKNGGRTYIEPKDNVRDRLGHSPDLADVCAMALGGAAETCSVGGYVGDL